MSGGGDCLVGGGNDVVGKVDQSAPGWLGQRDQLVGRTLAACGPGDAFVAGLASFRAGVYPRILCVAIMIGGLISYGAGLPPYGIPVALAVAAVGVWCLVHPERRSVETTERLAVTP